MVKNKNERSEESMIIFNYNGELTFSFQGNKDKNIENVIPKELKGTKVKIWAITGIENFIIEYENEIFSYKGFKNKDLNKLMEEIIYSREMEKEIQKY